MPKYFTKIPNYVIFNPGLTVSEFRILAMLYSLNPCYPSLQSICINTGLSMKTVQRALKGLKSKNVISWKSGNSRGKNNTYTIHPRSKWSMAKNGYRTIVKNGQPTILIIEPEEYYSSFNEKTLAEIEYETMSIEELDKQRFSADQLDKDPEFEPK